MIRSDLTMKYTIENNFNDEIIYTSARGKDLKIEVIAEARKHEKKMTDFIIKKL